MPFIPVAFSLVVTGEWVVDQLPQLGQHKALLQAWLQAGSLLICMF